jgi:hypothetical protein
MEQWSDVRPDEMARSSGRLIVNRNLRSAKSSERALNSEIHVYSIFTHTSDFVQTQNEAKILTNSPFAHSGTKIHLTGLEIHSWSKQKLLSLFVTKGQRVKQSNNNQL